MYPIPPSEHLVEEKKCRQCSTPFPITDKDMEFYLKVSPVFPISPLCKEGAEWNEAGDFVSEVSRRNPPSLDTLGIPPLQRRYTIPPPTLCPDCRQQRRLAFRNERRLYKRKCDATGKDIVSIYSPDKPNRVYHQEYWWSDVWDPMSYGREFDFSRGAIEQMGKVYTDLPKVNLWIRLDMENCEYCNFWTNSKSCYMTTAPHHSQDCFNTNTPIYCTNDFDGIFNIQWNHLYECIHTTQCTNISYSRYCQICKNSSYLIDCVDCDDCFGCIGLHHKKYYFLNTKIPPKFSISP